LSSSLLTSRDAIAGSVCDHDAAMHLELRRQRAHLDPVPVLLDQVVDFA
jgi:hypothetical protein